MYFSKMLVLATFRLKKLKIIRFVSSLQTKLKNNSPDTATKPLTVRLCIVQVNEQQCIRDSTYEFKVSTGYFCLHLLLDSAVSL